MTTPLVECGASLRVAIVATSPPLCVDLDGTLTPVDTLHENLVALIRQNPRALLAIPFWLHEGKARMKHEMAARAKFNASLLPINQHLLVWLQSERAGGRTLVLATAADLRIAEQIAAETGLFDEIIASDGKTNLSADAKRQALVERFGERGFDYVGNEEADERVWRSARKAIVVGSQRQIDRTRRVAEIDRVFIATPPSPMIWVKALRLHQWAKNTLIFLPALLAHQILVPGVLVACVLAFLAFGLCASSVYVVNDLLDLSADRLHPRKCKRAFASGQLSVRSGGVAATALLSASALLALLVDPMFAAVLAGYYLLTWSYSLRLKRAALVDVMTLAGLYTIRIIAGGGGHLHLALVLASGILNVHFFEPRFREALHRTRRGAKIQQKHLPQPRLRRRRLTASTESRCYFRVLHGRGHGLVHRQFEFPGALPSP